MLAGTRPARAADRPLLLEVFAESRDLALQALPPQVLATVMEQQFSAQEASFAARTPEIEDLVILAADGAPCGRLVLQDAADALRVVEVAILPSHRGAGIGAEVLRQVQARARIADRPVELAAHRGSPVLGLYRRLGFRVTAQDESRCSLRWTPG